MTMTANGIEWAVLGYLTNAVWQVPLVFGAAWGAAKLVRRAGAAVEHRVWVAALLLEVGLPGLRLDLSAVWGSLLGMFVGRAGQEGGKVQVAVEPGVVSALSGLRLSAEVLAAVVMMFVVAVVYFAARLVWGVWRTHVMRRRAVPVVLEGDAAQVWRRCGGESRGTEIRISGMVSGPVTVGVIRSAVLVSAGFLERVGGEDLAAVLAHEMAHVRRGDFAKNLIYEAVSLVVAWHPAVWMTRARVAESREMVCDAMAAEAVAGKESYARSLLRLASLVADRGTAKTLHAIGIFDANSFERRVMNLTKRRVEVRTAQRIGLITACALVALGTCATGLALRVEVGPQVQAVAAGVGADPAKVEPGNLKLAYKKSPVYPAEARAKKDTVDGAVELAVTIGKDGAVESIHVKKSLRADYDRSALEAVREWRWEPYLLNGKPTEVESTVTVNYSIPHDQDRPQAHATAEMDKVGVADADRSRAMGPMPKLIHQVDAVHPADARTRNDMLNGSVMLGLTVDKDGSVEALHVEKSLRADYDQSALAAVRQYRFEPAFFSGQPVAKNIVIEIDFRIY